MQVKHLQNVFTQLSEEINLSSNGNYTNIASCHNNVKYEEEHASVACFR